VVALAAGVALIFPRCGTTTEKMRKAFIALQVSGLAQSYLQLFAVICSKSGCRKIKQ
jgi:hypothetical protein